ncbi:leucine-zipper-like transcriptional regulator 1 isoform X2 [Grus americana]|uniref:leucine-zipper-like transcriptional regulator 1 isoform X2 n=1 Tax=Grus americana TaxID=9117 RepID=UPI0024085E6D|nr:leucine-zipper-like transcriptional regulator 1 isoform X2 [Grus americana]
MKGKTGHCDWKSAPQKKPSPCDRYKHACIICRGFVYLYGGRNTTSLRDFWRYNIVKKEWEMLDCPRDGPEELEEHSMVAYKSLAPTNRRGHSAVVYHSSMYIYGGYFGIRGISQEFWTFHFDTRKWLRISTPLHNTGPGPRHGHSAVVYHTGMYLFGGLMGLSEQKDLWKWDFVSRSWSNIRTSQGPPPVVGHASIVFKDSMLIFGGGISNSSPNNDLWKYHFHTQTWKKLSSTTKANFSSKMYHCILGIGVDFQTTSDFTNTFPSHWNSKQKDHHQLVTIPKHTRFYNYFHQQPAYRAFGHEESNAIEMKTFSLPLEPGGFCAFQTTSEAELDPNRATSILSKDESLRLFVSSEKETFAAAQVVGEEGTDCQYATAVDEVGSDTNVLLLVGGKPLSSFSEISFWQMEFDSL